jgi:hypothetical protein
MPLLAFVSVTHFVLAVSIVRKFSMIWVSCLRSTVPPNRAIDRTDPKMQSGTIKIEPRIIKMPWAVPPRTMVMIPMMMQATATGQTMNHAPQPRNGMSETTSVTPSSDQLTTARVFVPLREG